MAPTPKSASKSARLPAKKRKASPRQLGALRKARAVKVVRARAHKAKGGRGLIRDRPAARKILKP